MQIVDIKTPFGLLKIKSETISINFIRNILMPYNGDKLIKNDQFEVNIVNKVQSKNVNYRSKQVAKGLYIGHHFGPPGDISIYTDKIYFHLSNNSDSTYEKFFWNYILKFYYTYMALKHNSLHLKGLILEKNNKGYLFLGRGGAGKSTLYNALKKYKFNIISNTHAIFHNNLLYGVKSWIRMRKNNREWYEPPPTEGKDTVPLDKIILYNYNKQGFFSLKTIKKDDLLPFMLQFSIATHNYDLKEDMADVLQLQYMEMIKREFYNLINMLETTKLYTASCDVFSQKAVLNFSQVL